MFETKVMSLRRNSGTSTWPLILGKSFSEIKLAADHRDDTLKTNQQLILGKSFSEIKLAADHRDDTNLILGRIFRINEFKCGML